MVQINQVATKAPVLFISHGAPTFALEPGVLGAQLQSMGQRLTEVKTVLVVSAHWQTQGVKVMATLQPETVHDFGGFPASLYALRYPAAGQPAIARDVARLLEAAGWSVSLDARRGLDHGAWVPLYHLLPKANVPVFQVSMPSELTTQSAFKLGQALAPLREQGVLILASGSMTHNLYEILQPGSAPEPYALEFANWVKNAVLANAIQSIIHYRSEAPQAQRAHPTQEHFLPLLVALGARDDSDTAQWIDGGIEFGVLSMDSYVWGMQ
jgi:4,5-DOPA dioxygenase extradiol